MLCFAVVNSLHILNEKCFTPESAHAEMGSISDAEHELQLVEEKIHDAEQDKAHYEDVMERKVLAPIKMAESELTDLQQLHQVIALSLAISLCSGHLFFFFVLIIHISCTVKRFYILI